MSQRWPTKERITIKGLKGVNYIECTAFLFTTNSAQEAPSTRL